MVRAHSLLYAIFVCLIVAVLCAGLLYAANLYNQLNVYYNTHEELYIHNQSLVNYALGEMQESGSLPLDENEGIESAYETKPYGLLQLIIAHSFIEGDTVTSSHFAVPNTVDKTCVFLTNINRPLTYSGDVVLVGNKKLPSIFIKPIHIDNRPNHLEKDVGLVQVSETKLPDMNQQLKDAFSINSAQSFELQEVVKSDSVFFNSFRNPLLELRLKGNELGNVNIKGNVLITGTDSILIKKTARLEDVIIKASRIYFEEGFEGTLQAFAGTKIETAKGVKLNYPSALCVNNTYANKGGILLKEGSVVNGVLVLCGNEMQMLENNIMFIEKEGLITGSIYCTGRLVLQSDVNGSVYTNWFVHKTASTGYDNCLADIEINILKRPQFFIPLPLLDNSNKSYETIKKVM
ncbi:hypothetical protein [Flavobacterium sp. C4GT6]|uniref:hypothetical protein n=1 Tax=Flavobacterium sp. C4GT6 TaxID=3103818 RepID=UPI002ED08CBB